MWSTASKSLNRRPCCSCDLEQVTPPCSHLALVLRLAVRWGKWARVKTENCFGCGVDIFLKHLKSLLCSSNSFSTLDRVQTRLTFSSVQFSCSVVSDSLQPNGLQHARPSCPSPTPGVYSNSYPLSQWCHPTISPPLSIKHAQSLSCVQFFMTPWTVAHQATLSMGFSRQQYWTGLPFCSSREFSIPSSSSGSFPSPALWSLVEQTQLSFEWILVWPEKPLLRSFSWKGPFSPLGEAAGERNSLCNGVIARMPRTRFFSNYHIFWQLVWKLLTKKIFFQPESFQLEIQVYQSITLKNTLKEKFRF